MERNYFSLFYSRAPRRNGRGTLQTFISTVTIARLLVCSFHAISSLLFFSIFIFTATKFEPLTFFSQPFLPFHVTRWAVHNSEKKASEESLYICVCCFNIVSKESEREFNPEFIVQFKYVFIHHTYINIFHTHTHTHN